MFYSIIWSTEDRSDESMNYLDLAENKERWLAKLGSWGDALEVYEDKLTRNPDDFDATLGCMRCLSSSGEWSRVLELGEENWQAISASPANLSAVSQATVVASREQKKAMRMCAEASWRLGRWNDLDKYSSELVHGQGNMKFGSVVSPTANRSGDGSIPRVDFEGAFFSAVLHVHRDEWQMAAEAIDASRKAMDGRFTALMAESYNRAYPSMVTAQTLAELEEIVEYRKIENSCKAKAHRHPSSGPDSSEARERLLSVWRDRLAGCRFDAEVHSSIMAVRSLILGPTDEVDATLTLSELSRQAQRFKLAERVLLDPLEKLGADLNGVVFGFGLAESLGLRASMEDAMRRFPVARIIDGLVTSDSVSYLPQCTDAHYQWSKQLVDEAGGLDRPVVERKSAAESLMNSLRSHSSSLVEEALMVSSELIRVAILWLETWHEGLEEASRLYFGEGNVSGMLDLLIPLHEKLEKGAETRREGEFIEAFGSDLAQAYQHLKDYVRLVESAPSASDSSTVRQNEEAETAMNKAWDIYYTVFRRINKQLPALTRLELTDCSPALSTARGLELGVPGSYRVDGSFVKIEKFVQNVQVITSKQRPRKITLRGNDGKDYVFLLKGHEDLRQDERVMQLFGLVNALLERDRQTKKQDLRIQRYAVAPLSHNCGLVGWVPHTDTLHSLIRDYRQSKKIPLNLEHREMVRIAPDYDQLTVMQKVEVFVEALKKTTGNGNDLVLHIDFGDCFEVAMHREKYPEKVPFRLTRMLIKAMEVSGIEGSYRSTCERTMSVLRESRDSLVAMLEAFLYDPLISWRLVDLSKSNGALDGRGISRPGLSSGFHGDHDNGGLETDPGVAIEVNSSRTGVLPISEGDENGDDEGSEDIVIAGGLDQIPSVPVTRHRDVAISATRARSLQMYSNIQTWAANLGADERIASITGGDGNNAVSGSIARSRKVERSLRQREVLSLLEGDYCQEAEETLNEKALKVIRRVQDKLNGTDFEDRAETGEPLDVVNQVQRLTVQATSVENLAQLFIGWCAFW
ncbi:MAG: hypothetical protein SGILL_000585 [Bacillariaceae sp.]